MNIHIIALNEIRIIEVPDKKSSNRRECVSRRQTFRIIEGTGTLVFFLLTIEVFSGDYSAFSSIRGVFRIIE